MVLGDGKWEMGRGFEGGHPLTSLGRLFVILPLGHLRQQCHLPKNRRSQAQPVTPKGYSTPLENP